MGQLGGFQHLSIQCSISLDTSLIRSSNVVYFRSAKGFRDIRNLLGTVPGMEPCVFFGERIRSGIGRTCPRNHGLFPNVNLGGQIVR